MFVQEKKNASKKTCSMEYIHLVCLRKTKIKNEWNSKCLTKSF